MKTNLQQILNNKENLKRSFDFYCENELKSFKQSEYYKEMSALAQQLNFDVDCSIGFGAEDFNTIFFGVEIKDKNNNIVCVGDNFDKDELSYATSLIAFLKQKYYKFFCWSEDDDFIETVEWIIAQLRQYKK